MGSPDGKPLSFSCNLDSPIKALAVNRDGDQVVAAGRNLLRIFSIENNRFVERESLRFAKKNLNCACTDVAWNPVDENILASSTTTGAICIWNLSMTSPIKQEMVFSEHRRTTNRICFHSKEAHILLSGSQDASAILFDLRKKEQAMVYRCEESVRDVRFSPHQYFHFAVCLENGNVQMFDMRKADLCEREFTCHTGPVFQSHFHPSDKSLIATCGRDKSIKVWNITDNKNPSLECMVPTVAPMGSIAWRPDRRYHIASTALITDFSINVWDLRRPYIPFASFEKHTDLVTSLIWRQDPQVILAGSKDGFLSQFSFQDAKRPADKVNPIGLSIGCYGDIAQACNKRIISGEVLKFEQSKLNGSQHVKKNLAEEFLLNANSKLSLYPHDELKMLSMDWFVSCAREYLLYGHPISELCRHNAIVAENAGRNQVAQVWRIISSLYFGCDNRIKSAHPSGEPRSVHTRFTDGKRDDALLVSRVEDAANLSELVADPTFHRGGRILSAKEPNSMGLEPPTSNTGDFLFNEQTVFEEAETPYSGMDSIIDEDNWQLPSEGFQLRSELPDRSCRLDIIASKADLNRSRNRSGSLGPDDPDDDALRLGCLMPDLSSGPRLDFTDLVVETIRYHAEQTDLQTAISLILVLGEKARGMVNENLLETWLLEYIEMLHHFELFSVANVVIKLSHVNSIAELNQQSTTVYTSCNTCSKHLHKTGMSCKKLTNCCSICQLPVRGLYVWCQGCSHGGHLEHIQEWLKKNSQCPTGCGHFCEYI